MKTNFKLLIVVGTMLFASCESDDASEPLTVERVVETETVVEVVKDPLVTEQLEVDDTTVFDNGFFVSAEGNFGSKDGSVSYVSNDLKTSTNFVFRKKNANKPLAGLIQSIAFNDENAYIINNDGAIITIVDRVTLKEKAIITSGLENPRYMAIIGNKGYITNWGDGLDTTDDYIAVLDLTTNTLDPNTIPLANGVEQIVSRDGKLYVSHKGAFSNNNIISVIDTNNNNAVETITVKDHPDELFFIPSGALVVLSEGHNFFNSTFSEIIRRSDGAISFIDVSTNTVTKELPLPVGNRASLLAQDKGNIYYYSNDSVFTINETTINLPTEGIEVGNIYGMNVKENTLYTCSTAFTTFSTLKAIDLESTSLTFVSVVGLGASKIYF